jgi:hemoglobin-like flavoprotein
VQEKMLQEALVAVLDHVEDASWLTKTLHGMGAQHVEYGVRDEMYDWVGGALLETLGEVAGEDWSPELKEQWAMAYRAISGLMKEGARNAILSTAAQQAAAIAPRPTA